MLKFGITNLYQMHNRKFKTFLKRKRGNISITLYDKIHTFSDADIIAERILLLFSDERGAYPKRFEEFDAQIIHELCKFPAPQTFHDVGISDGRTAVDFFEKIARAFPDIQYVASDYNPSVFVVEKGRLKVTLSHTGKVLEILFPPFVFNKIRKENFCCYPLNHLVRFFVEKLYVRPLLKQYHQGHIQAKELLLFAPNVLQKAHTDKRFQLRQYDLLQPFKERSDIIRAMNVLNLSYFSKTEFIHVIRNLYEGLTEGGLVITGSNQDAGTPVNGGIYQKKGKGFKKIFGSGTGSPIEDLFLNFKA